MYRRGTEPTEKTATDITTIVGTFTPREGDRIVYLIEGGGEDSILEYIGGAWRVTAATAAGMKAATAWLLKPLLQSGKTIGQAQAALSAVGVRMLYSDLRLLAAEINVLPGESAALLESLKKQPAERAALNAVPAADDEPSMKMDAVPSPGSVASGECTWPNGASARFMITKDGRVTARPGDTRPTQQQQAGLVSAIQKEFQQRQRR